MAHSCLLMNVPPLLLANLATQSPNPLQPNTEKLSEKSILMLNTHILLPRIGRKSQPRIPPTPRMIDFHRKKTMSAIPSSISIDRACAREKVDDAPPSLSSVTFLSYFLCLTLPEGGTYVVRSGHRQGTKRRGKGKRDREEDHSRLITELCRRRRRRRRRL